MAMHAVRLTSNGGHCAAPGVVSFDPVHGTGQTATDAATGGDHTLTVVGGKSYAVIADATGNFLLGIADVTTAANVAWFVPAGTAAIINMPEGKNTLHYQCDTNGGTIKLTEIYRNPSNQ